ncbi:hypothetical protein [Neorhizobium galegae]|uniref:hypothetical protein n=1 Tax=Neorhizobium galegae TaxID=399 RepID=UPI001F3AA36C|nr:hypothetical protein [Neorhizobium galegae]UIK08768.1 hypothetical protein LZK81_25120 [Neorhizobium galegae]
MVPHFADPNALDSAQKLLCNFVASKKNLHLIAGVGRQWAWRAVRDDQSRVTEVIEKEHGQVHLDAKPLLDRSAFEPDARSRAMLEGIRIAQEDLRDAGGAYDLDQVRTLMRGVSRQAIDKRVQEGSLLAVPGLKAVREALQTSNPWSMLNFLSHADVRLNNRKPIDLLKSGKLDVVLEAARRQGEQGA